MPGLDRQLRPSPSSRQGQVTGLDLYHLEQSGELARALIAGLPGSGLLVIDAEMRILLIDGDAYARLDRDETLMRPLPEVIPTASREALLPRLAAAIGGEAQSFEYDSVSDRSTHWVRLAPIRDDGVLAGVLVLSQDITETVAATRRLATSARLESAVLAALDEGVVVLDLDGGLIQANPAARTILGVDLASTAVNPAWWEPLTTRHAKDGFGSPVSARALLTRTGTWDLTIELDRPDGTTASLSVNYLPLLDEAGALSGLVVSFCDVTVRKREHNRLLEMQDRLREAHEVAGLASWEWLPHSDEVTVFHALRESNQPSGARATLDATLALMPAAERQTMRGDLAAFSHGEREYAVRRHQHAFSHGMAWLETRSRAVRADDGRLLSVRGTSQDVTEQELSRLELARSRDFFQETLDSLTASLAVLDKDGEILATNRAWDQFARDNGASVAQCRGNYLRSCDAAGGDEWAQRAAGGLRGILAGRKTEFSMEYPCHSPSVERWFVMRATPYSGDGDARIVVNHGDVTRRREAQNEVTTQAALLDEIDVAVIATDADRRISHWNRGAEHLYGWTSDEVLGRMAGEVIMPTDRADVSMLTDLLHGAGHWEGELTVRRKDGSTFPAFVRDRAIPRNDRLPAGVVSISVDLSERVASERALLAARNYLKAVTDSVGEGLYSADTEGRLTYMNDAAEKILEWTLDELRGCVMHPIVHSRRPDGSELSAAECPILLSLRNGETVHVEDEVFVARDGRLIPIAYTASPFETDDGEQGCVVAFEDVTERRQREQRQQRDVEKLGGIERVQEALAGDRMLLFAQPIIDLQTGKIVQRELLLRVREPGGKVVGPDAYLPIAEEYGLIGDIDRWVIARACEIAGANMSVQVNVSARSIGDPTMLHHIERCIEQSNVDPRLLVFEITETALVEDEAAAAEFAERLHRIGCKLALDDFGTGYGSFTYLKRLSVDYLKIDVEFVRDLASSPASRHVVAAVVALAHAFSLQTIGEGVENAETLELLKELEVDFAQGYHIGKPASLEPSGGVESGKLSRASPPATGSRPSYQVIAQPNGTTTHP
jgi:PAS domain S-box-containing protein